MKYSQTSTLKVKRLPLNQSFTVSPKTLFQEISQLRFAKRNLQKMFKSDSQSRCLVVEIIVEIKIEIMIEIMVERQCNGRV